MTLGIIIGFIVFMNMDYIIYKEFAIYSVIQLYIQFVKNHKYTIEEKIINLCDLMCPQEGKIFTIDKKTY